MFRPFLSGVVLMLSFVSAVAEVADFYAPSTSSSLKSMKEGPVTVAITQGDGAKKPSADADGLGCIEFYPENVMSIKVADGYYLKSITIGTAQSVFMEPVGLSCGQLDESSMSFVWSPAVGEGVTSMSLINGSEDPSGKNRKYTSISVISVEYDVPDAEMMTPVITNEDLTLLADGSYQANISLLNARYELYYLVVMRGRDDDDVHAGFTLAGGSGTERTIILPASSFLTYYVYDPTTETKGVERTIPVGAGESLLRELSRIGASNNQIFDLQGRTVSLLRRGGIYLQGGKKIILK